MTQEEYNSMLVSAREQFKQGTPLFGKEGAFHRILEDFQNSALEGEMESHLSVTSPTRCGLRLSHGEPVALTRFTQ